MLKMKKYPVLPVVIEEDHHNVLPHIYRSIGSKYLPLKDVTLVHFDSHPDMLIPVDMPADHVYNKQLLFDTLSIENWILPAVFAGHISHVVWIKPPWCSQVEDKSVTFYVGKCSKTGTIRTTCTESYFISETLYVPGDQLDDKQLLRFTVVSLIPRIWSLDEKGDNCCNTEVKGGDNQPTVEIAYEKGDKSCHSTVKGDNTCHTKVQGSNNEQMSGFAAIKDITESPSTQVELESDDNKVVHHSKSDTTDKDTPCTGVKRRDNDPIGRNREDLHTLETNNSNSSKKAKIGFPGKSLAEIDIPKASVSNGTAMSIDGKQFISPPNETLQQLSSYLQGQCYILDIDLDFYSTMNPFRQMYGEKQYKILQELYKFEKPTSLSEKDVESCVARRQKQLMELKQVFGTLEKDENAEVTHPRSDLITTLISELKDTSPVIDYELLHEAGCTCDDTELPHHVSSNSQIELLIDTTQDLLSYFPKPTYITIARSSSDDYCPPDQVDMIQDRVLIMLQELYLEISVNMAYKDDEFNS